MKNKNLRNLTFGDLAADCKHIKLPADEAALIVLDKTKMLRSRTDSSINPFVCAVAGPEANVLAEKKKYENDQKYDVTYFPAEC